MKRPSIEDVLIWGCVLFTALIMLWLVMGCASKKYSNYDVLWMDGKCTLHVTNVTLEEAEAIQKDWDFAHCSVDVEIEDGEDEGVSNEGE